jgi:hypothetical protein
MLQVRPATSNEDLARLAHIVCTVTPAPMRAVNSRLGYQPRPDEICYRGPVTRPSEVPG